MGSISVCRVLLWNPGPQHRSHDLHCYSCSLLALPTVCLSALHFLHCLPAPPPHCPSGSLLMINALWGRSWSLGPALSMGKLPSL